MVGNQGVRLVYLVLGGCLVMQRGGQRPRSLPIVRLRFVIGIKTGRGSRIVGTRLYRIPGIEWARLASWHLILPHAELPRKPFSAGDVHGGVHNRFPHHRSSNHGGELSPGAGGGTLALVAPGGLCAREPIGAISLQRCYPRINDPLRTRNPFVNLRRQNGSNSTGKVNLSDP